MLRFLNNSYDANISMLALANCTGMMLVQKHRTILPKM